MPIFQFYMISRGFKFFIYFLISIIIHNFILSVPVIDGTTRCLIEENNLLFCQIEENLNKFKVRNLNCPVFVIFQFFCIVVIQP